MLPSTWTSFLSTLLAVFSNHQPYPASTQSSSEFKFELRHLHAVSSTADVVFHDIRTSSDPAANAVSESYTLAVQPVRTHRPPSFAAHSRARTRSMRFHESESLPWDPDDVPGPDINSRETLLMLAKMTSNAYLEPTDAGWYDLGGTWNVSYPFGWEPDSDGFRGHVFATADNSTVVVSIKGTSAAYVGGGGGPTGKKDKLNDNLLFSCCCAHVDWTWTTVCGCYRGGWKCDNECLQEALDDDSLFYHVGTNLYNNISYMYPNANIWMTGHSLGGSLASLVGVTFGAPAVAFEAPGDKMAAGRLHLPLPPTLQHITHVYHTADPIPMGTCNGVLSSCALGGYALESRCHLGQTIVYDTISNLSWASDIRTHTIVNVIERVLGVPWAPSIEVGREVPEAVPQEDCVECFSWEYGDFPLGKVING